VLLFHLCENAHVASRIGKFQLQRLVGTDDNVLVLARSGIIENERADEFDASMWNGQVISGEDTKFV
jgi:hypothetical protein